MLPVDPFIKSSPAKRDRLWLWLLFAGFGTVYCLISLVNHYNFRSAAMDFGLATHALHDYSQFQRHFSTLLIDSPPTNFLYAHFTLLPALFSPLYLIFGSWTLLLVQIVAILLGGAGVYRYVLTRGATLLQARLLTAYFFSLWGIYSALSFDYHDNVVGAMTVPWLLHWFDRKHYLPAALAFIILLVSKENMSLWAACIMLGLAVRYRKHAILRNLAIAGSLLAIGYFFLITKVIMPSLDPGNRPYAQFGRYAHLGSSLVEIVSNVLLSPQRWFSLLFENTLGIKDYNYIKLEFWIVLLLSGGWAAFFRPWFLLMIVPLLAQKMLSNDYAFWGINNQYSIEFAPLLPLFVWDFVNRDRVQNRLRLMLVVLGIAATATLVTLYTRQSKWYMRELVNFLQPRHYKATVDAPRMRDVLELVPPDVPVSAYTNLAPWLTNRKELYHYPVLRNAQFIALIKKPHRPWPLDDVQYAQVLTKLRHRPDFKVRFEDDQFILFERIQPVTDPEEVLTP